MAGSAAGDLVITDTTGLSATATSDRIAISDHIGTSRRIDIVTTDIFVMNALGIDMVSMGTGTDLIYITTVTLVTAIVTDPGVDYEIFQCANPRSLQPYKAKRRSAMKNTWRWLFLAVVPLALAGCHIHSHYRHSDYYGYGSPYRHHQHGPYHPHRGHGHGHHRD